MFVSARNHELLKANGHYYGNVVSMAVVKKMPNGTLTRLMVIRSVPNAAAVGHLAGEVPSWDQGHFLELMACSQGCRPDDQRVSESHFPGFRLSNSSPPPTLSTSKPEQANAQGDLNISTANASTRQPAAGTLLNTYLLKDILFLFLYHSPHLQ